MGPKKVYLIRHGATKWSETGQHTGRTDLDLNETGVNEARELRLYVEELHIEKVFSSPLKRAIETAQLVGFHSFEFDNNLLEWDYGQVEGLTTDDMRKKIPGWTIFKNGVEGGETLEEVYERAKKVVIKVREQDVNSVALCAHGHILRVVATAWLGIEPINASRLELSPTSISVLGFEHGEPSIQYWNWIPSIA
ncbi:MAG: histidine phosphatase family protein [Acidimicrobiales bacterium]|nr:histidine phosphatase family protein [Acidimicrobiales bacterium]